MRKAKKCKSGFLFIHFSSRQEGENDLRELAQHCPNKSLGKSISWGFLLIVAASGLIGRIRATNFERP